MVFHGNQHLVSASSPAKDSSGFTFFFVKTLTYTHIPGHDKMRRVNVINFQTLNSILFLCIFFALYAVVCNNSVIVNSVDPDQTAPSRAV